MSSSRKNKLLNQEEINDIVLSPYLDNKELGRLSTSCVTLYTQTNILREKRAFLQYLQAIIFNDPSIISPILHCYPDFLLAKPEDYGIMKIKCQTGLQYLTKGESAFSMAQKMRHVSVLEAMLEHYLEKLKDKEIDEEKPSITELENMWILQIPTIKEQEELQKKYYQELIFPMINVLRTDATIEVEWMPNPETGLYQAKIDNAREATLNARNALRDELFRPKAMRECIDVVQFFIAAIKAYPINFNMNNHIHPHGAQRDAYRIWIIGLAQSLVGLDLAMLLHKGLDDMVENHGTIGARFYNCLTHTLTDSLTLSDLRSFYRRACDHGLGSSFLYSIYADISPNSFGPAMEFADLSEPVNRAYKLFQARASECVELTQRVQQRQETWKKQKV